MPDDLYRRDALAWAERQVALLRRLASGGRLNEMVDWANVIGEVQDVGLSELRACQNPLQQAMTRLLKLHAGPARRSAGHWRSEAGTFLDDAEQRSTPSLRLRIELDDLYAKALRRARETVDDAGVPQSLPMNCPLTLDELLAGNTTE